ncbi:MAG: glycosyltransferase [Muribaculaceae bacterium]
MIKDIYDGNLITEMSHLEAPKAVNHSNLVIMTAGRLNKPQKGYDIALATAKELRDRNFRFHWYAIGEGPYRAEMEQYIAEHNLQEYFTLLGSTANPYSYMRQCDIYVQTSRHEGFGLTIAEARILNRPVVCTNFEACSMQMIDGKNGLVTSFDPKDIADAIMRLASDKQLYSDIQDFLKSEKKGNTEEINNFYSLIHS